MPHCRGPQNIQHKSSNVSSRNSSILPVVTEFKHKMHSKSSLKCITVCFLCILSLVVSFNNIGNKGLCALADALKVNTSLKQIFIWGNKLEEPATIVSTWTSDLLILLKLTRYVTHNITLYKSS